jgi:hypothetical protein
MKLREELFFWGVIATALAILLALTVCQATEPTPPARFPDTVGESLPF